MLDLPRFFVTIRYSTPDSERFTPYEMLRNLSMSKLLVRFPDHFAGVPDNYKKSRRQSASANQTSGSVSYFRDSDPGPPHYQ